jgi:hypothetical protein
MQSLDNVLCVEGKMIEDFILQYLIVHAKEKTAWLTLFMIFTGTLHIIYLTTTDYQRQRTWYFWRIWNVIGLLICAGWLVSS